MLSSLRSGFLSAPKYLVISARAVSLSPADLVVRLDQRFKLLARGSRASLARHQTLRNTIDWSYDLLDERERTALNRLSVFAGGCDLQAAEHVLEREGVDALDVIDTLDLLVDKSLVLADQNLSVPSNIAGGLLLAGALLATTWSWSRDATWTVRRPSRASRWSCRCRAAATRRCQNATGR